MNECTLSMCCWLHLFLLIVFNCTYWGVVLLIPFFVLLYSCIDIWEGVLLEDCSALVWLLVTLLANILWYVGSSACCETAAADEGGPVFFCSSGRKGLAEAVTTLLPKLSSVTFRLWVLLVRWCSRVVCWPYSGPKTSGKWHYIRIRIYRNKQFGFSTINLLLGKLCFMLRAVCIIININHQSIF